MNTVLQLIRSDQWGTTILIVLVLMQFGKWAMAYECPGRVWGLRLATSSFVAYIAYTCIESNHELTSSDVLKIVLQGALAAGLACGVSWIAMSLILGIYNMSVVPVLHKAAAVRRSVRAALRDRRTKSDATKQRKTEELNYERQAPLREQQRIREEERQQLSLEQQVRRDKARADCLRLFMLLARDLKNRFTRQMFDEYVERYLSDSRLAEDVESHAVELQSLIQQHYEKLAPPTKFRSVEDINRWFQEQKRNLDAITDDVMRRSFISRLEDRYTELTIRFLEEDN